MSGKRTLSLSAYKKSKEALAVAPAKRLGFGESVSTREARAQELQLEAQVIGRLDGLLRRCGKDPGSAQAISNWLCAEGLEGHAKKGLSRILCHVKVWSRTLRSEGVTPKETEGDQDAAEARARAAFGACVSAISAVDSLSYRFAEKINPRNGECELVKIAGEVIAGMADAMIGAGAKPRARGLHPTEHAQLSRMLDSWRKRGAMPSPSLDSIGKHLTALRPGDADSSEDGGGATRGSKARGKTKNQRAAWVRVPAAAAVPSADNSPGAAASGPAGVGRLSPARPSSGSGIGGVGGGGSRLPVAPQTEIERQTSLETALKEHLSRNVAVAGGWWAQAFQGSGPFPQGPEGCWSLQFRRANEDPEHRQQQVRGLVGDNGDYYRRDSGGVDPGGVKTEAVDGMDSDAAPSTPSTVPSEASPSPERASPVPAVKAEETKDLDVKPAVGRGENGTKAAAGAAAQDGGKSSRDGKEGPDAKGKGAGGAKEPRSPKRPALSKREEEEEERRRRKEEARRAGKEKGKAKAQERERQKKERELQRQKMIADSRKKKADEEAARREKDKEAKHKVDELACRSGAGGGSAAAEGDRQRESSRKREPPAAATDKSGTNQPKGDVAAEESRRDHHRGGSSRSQERQDRTRDREGRDRAGGVNGRASYAGVERTGGGGGSGGRDKDDTLRDSWGRSDKEGRGERGKDADRAPRRRDKDESRRYHDRGESREAPPRGDNRGRQDPHEQPRAEDRGSAGDGWRKRGSSSQRAREEDLVADGGGRRGLDGRECEAGDKGERKRRRSDPSESEGVLSSRYSGDRYFNELADDDRSSSHHRPSKKKSKKDKRDRKEKRAERQSDAAAARLAARAGSEESTRGRKRSRDFDWGGGVKDPEGYAASAAPQGDPGRRSLDPHRQPSEPELGRTGSQARDLARQSAGRSRRESASPRRGDRRDRDGSEKRARRGSGDDASSVHSRSGASRERHSRGVGRESALGASSSGGGGGGSGVDDNGGGVGLPGMEGYSSAASPPVSAELGGFASALGSLKALDAYGPAIVRGDSPDGGRRRRGDAYGPGMDDSGRSGGRSDRDRLDRDRSERDRSERDYSRSADKSLRDSSGRRGDAASRQSSSSNTRGSRRSPERGTSATSARDGPYRRRPGSPTRDDSRERSSSARDGGRHSKSGGGGGGSSSSALSGGGSGGRSQSSMATGSLGMGMGVSIIGGTPVLMPMAKIMEAQSASSRSGGGGGGGGDNRRSRDDRDRDRDRDRYNGSGSSRWGGGDGQDRWAGDSPSEDDLDRAGGGRSEAHSRRRDNGGGGSGNHLSRADSRAVRQAQGYASPQQEEEEPEEGELVIESSSAPPAALPSLPVSPRGKKSRWGHVGDEASSTTGAGGGGRRLSGHAASASRADRWPSRERGERSIGTGAGAGAGDGEDGNNKSTRGRDAKSPERSSKEGRSGSRRGSADAETGERSGRSESGEIERSPSGSKEPAEKDTLSPRVPAGQAGTAAAAAAATMHESTETAEPSAATSSRTTTVDERGASGSTEDGDLTAVEAATSGNDGPTACGSSADGPAQNQAAPAEGQESTAPETGEGDAAASSTAAQNLKDKDAAAAAAGKSSSKDDDNRETEMPRFSSSAKEGDSDRPAPSGGGREEASGSATRRRSSGDFTPFLRKDGSRKEPEEPVSPVAPAADATEPSGQEGNTPADDERVGDCAAAADAAAAAAAAAAATKSQRSSVLSRLGAPPREAEQDGATTKTAAGGTPNSVPAPPRGMASTWGSGSSADWGASGKDTSGGGDNGNGKGNDNAEAPAAEASDTIPLRRTRSAGKDEARPVGGGAGRLMNAALSSSRDTARSGKKGGAGGRGRGGGRRQRE
eukprot:g9059.t1